MNELAHEVAALTNVRVSLAGIRPAIEYHPLPADDPLQRSPDIRLARERLGWAPRVGLHAGLQATVDYFRERLGQRKDARAPGLTEEVSEVRMRAGA